MANNEVFLSQNFLNSNGPTEGQYSVQRAKTLKKKARKIKDGTDGIDAVDERSEGERFNEGCEMLDLKD